jgi:hypothetical protein
MATAAANHIGAMARAGWQATARTPALKALQDYVYR